MNSTLYQFVIAYQSNQELDDTKSSETISPPEQKVILSNGQPNFKTIGVWSTTLEEAISKAEVYTEKTLYKDIVDNTTI